MADTAGIRSTITANGGTVVLPTGGLPVVGLDLQGTWVATLEVEETIDGDEWAAAKVYDLDDVAASSTITTNVRRNVDARGKAAIRLRATAWTSAPTIVMTATEGRVGASTAVAVTVANGADTAQGSTTDAGITTDTNGTVIGFLRGAIKMWINFLARFPAALGGTTAAASLPVTLATDGQFVSSVGAVTETAPATDIASSGLNGRLQRIAQRLTSLIALVPAALVSGRFDVNLGAAPAAVTAIGAAPAAPTCTFTRGANVTGYTIGDEVGTAGTAPTTISIARSNGLGGVIQGAQVVYSNAPVLTPSLVLLLFSATVTLAGDNAQLALSDADALKCIGFIPLSASQPGVYSAGAPSTAGNLILSGAPNRPIHFVAGGSEQTIYAALITLNAYTPIANSETAVVLLDVEQN